MKRKTFLATVAGVMIFGAGAQAGAIMETYKTNRGNIATVEPEMVHKGRIGLYVDGKDMTGQTWYSNGTTYVPLRIAADLLDVELLYDGKTQTAKLKVK